MAEDAAPRPLVEELADLVAELVDEVRTDEPVTRYQQVSRGAGRTVKVVDPRARHVVRDVGLLDQLHAIKSARHTIPVKIYQWKRDLDDPCRRDYGDDRDQRECPHGQWVFVRTDHRPAARLGAITSGAAIPGGSPGWDAGGALNPLRSMGFESASPATSAVELYDQIRRGVDMLRRDLREAAGRPWGGRKAPSAALRECVGLTTEVDDDTARAATTQIRAWWTAARILLRYDAPIVRLRDVICGRCAGDLHVRADASTAVWCAGHRPARVDGPALEGEDWPVVYPAVAGCGERYPRGSWIALLEQASSGERDAS